MEKIIILVRILLFFLSCCGYVQYLRKSVRTEFSVGLLFSGICCILILAGILNLLRIAAWVLFLGGLVLALHSIWQKQSTSGLLCPGTIFFLLLAALFPILLYGSEFVHYDNFTHWASAARILIEQHRFPNAQNTIILHTSYPMGSTCFIYYVCEIVGVSSEWMQMYAQAILMAGMTMSLFAFAKGRVSSLMIAFCCICLLCSNNKLFDILVDSLLSITALSAAAFCIYYGRNLKSRIWYLVPYAVFLINIKNSGLLFAIILYGYAWFTLRHEDIRPKTWLFLFAVPVIMLALWQVHVSLVFPGGMSGKHSMSLSYFSRVFQEKQFSEIQLIAKSLAMQVFSFSNRALWALLLGLALWLVWKSFSANPCQEMKATLLLAAVAYMLYQLGTLGMYLFSMPGAEAIRLAGYDRYHQTIIAFVVGLFLLEAMQASHQPLVSGNCRPLLLCTALAVLIACFFVLSPDFTCLQKQQLENTKRGRLDCLIADYDIQCGTDYLILTQEKDNGYLYFMGHYVLRPQELFVQSENELSLSGLSYIDYIIAFDESEKIDAFLSELSPGNTEPVFRLY